jgi:hypothetical protein
LESAERKAQSVMAIEQRRQAVDADTLRLAERVRTALVERALAAYEDGGIQGLCCEGAWEAAVSAMRRLDLNAVVTAPPAASTNHTPPSV